MSMRFSNKIGNYQEGVWAPKRKKKRRKKKYTKVEIIFFIIGFILRYIVTFGMVIACPVFTVHMVYKYGYDPTTQIWNYRSAIITGASSLLLFAGLAIFLSTGIMIFTTDDDKDTRGYY